MDETIAEAFVNRTHTVLGRKLKPFCLWHAFALELIGNPARGDFPYIDFRSLYIAVEICSRGYDPDLARVLQPGRWFRLKFLVRHWGWRKRIDRELAAFAAYKRDYRSFPLDRFYDASGDPSACGNHLTIIARLMRQGGYSEADAWELPEGKALWLSIALLEAGGKRSNMMSVAEYAAMQEAGRL